MLMKMGRTVKGKRQHAKGWGKQKTKGAHAREGAFGLTYQLGPLGPVMERA
jgi:hypothetical protein